MKYLGEALRLLRVHADLNQTEMSKLVGFGKPQVSEVESGKKNPSLDMVEKYAEALGIRVSSVFFLAENLLNPSLALSYVAIENRVLLILKMRSLSS